MKDEILTPTECKVIQGMSNYWEEVSQRDDVSPLYNELRQVNIQYGVRLLLVLARYVEMTEGGSDD